MDQLEKVEKLRERADISYEEAKAALEANNWDLLDAMVALERAGRTRQPQQPDFSTSYEEQGQYIPVQEKVFEQQNAKPHVGTSIREAVRKFFRICRDNSFRVMHNGNLVFQLPLFVLILILIFSWHVTLVVMVVALFFGCRYELKGKDDLSGANSLMDSVGNAADSIRESFAKKES